jgi:hypothetical protein
MEFDRFPHGRGERGGGLGVSAQERGGRFVPARLIGPWLAQACLVVRYDSLCRAQDLAAVLGDHLDAQVAVDDCVHLNLPPALAKFMRSEEALSLCDCPHGRRGKPSA